jgi:hypothetical protein
MKAARIMASLTLMLAGALCMIRFYNEPVDHSWVFPACAAALIVASILLLLQIKYAPAAGLVFSLTGVLLGMFLTGPAGNDLFLGLIYFLEVIAAIICFFLLLDKRKGKRRQFQGDD